MDCVSGEDHPGRVMSGRPSGRHHGHVTVLTKGDLMGKEARIGLLLGASACLLAVMVDWVIEELHQP